VSNTLQLLAAQFQLAAEQSGEVSRGTLALITGGAAALGSLIGGGVTGYFALRGERTRQEFASQAEESRRTYEEQRQKAAASGAVREWKSMLRINRDLLEVFRDTGTWWLPPQELQFFPQSPERQLVASLLQPGEWSRVAHAEAQLRWLEAIRLQHTRDADGRTPPPLPAALTKQKVFDAVMADLDGASDALAPHA
jgi:hypothetical protein